MPERGLPPAKGGQNGRAPVESFQSAGTRTRVDFCGSTLAERQKQKRPDHRAVLNIWRGGGTSNETVTLSGVATDDPINGGTVSVIGSNGTQQCSATTDAQGHYSCGINKEALTSGVTIEVTGGTLKGIPFVGRLEAIYGSGDPANAANVTLVTTLVSKIAATDAAGSTLISRRDAALQRLTDISLFGREEWNAPEPSSVGLPALRRDIATSGLSAVMDALAADLQDDDLSADNMQYFPKAHGGIVQLLLSGGDSQSRIDALPGDAVRAKVISALTGGSDATVGYEKIAGLEALTIDPTTGEVRITLSDVMADGETINFTVRASTAGGYRNITGKIIAHATQTVLEQLASGSQQVITDDFGRFVVEVPTNDTLPAGTKIRLRSFTNSEGHPVFRLDTDQPPAEGRSLLLRLADPDIFSSGEQGAAVGAVAAPTTRQQADRQVQGGLALLLSRRKHCVRERPTLNGARYLVGLHLQRSSTPD